ncbi:5809_t:CDS:1 [Cetraspora pellucida]|uniref:5809_t:CDS:1 n=1 Tax=Cetraspora pellucida TaxID=1433469 RepID=A0A9N9P7S4_9GLOM|nr:5809_t:CDS:1 [Cetraspora pellucida]
MKEYEEVFKINNTVKPVWVLFTDGGPDENPRFINNIYQYCCLFKKLDLDYLTIRTNAPGQSAFNPVERAMASLSKKLGEISFSIDTFGNHLDSQGKIINKDLGLRNFRHAGEALCNIWQRDKIFGKPVYCEYVDEESMPFSDVVFETNLGCNNEKANDEYEEPEVGNVEDTEQVLWAWIENHAKMCKYSLDIRKCEVPECCSPKRAPEVATLLEPTNGFLPPVIKGKDNHFLNPIHTVEYLDSAKLAKYDEHCPSISAELYACLVCKKCKKYFPTCAFLLNHKHLAHPKSK